MKFKRWTKIENCPQNEVFIAFLINGFKFKISRVYVHVDNNFLSWKVLKTMDGYSIGKWKCKFYIQK